jgi:hypothetical protein
MSIIHPQFCPKSLIMLQGPFCKFSKFLGSNCNCQNGRTKLKVLKIHNYTGILPIIHLLFCPESRNMPQGPICNVSKVWGLNCNFHKLRDQTKISLSSTSNPEFSQITYCYIMISNTNSPFKQNHNSKSSFYLQSLNIN